MPSTIWPTLKPSSFSRASPAEAKAKFSELIERARCSGPQTITRKGHTTAVVVSAEEWERKTKRTGNLAEFFAASPLRGSKVRVGRVKTCRTAR
jgi:prevent-host-death family protein